MGYSRAEKVRLTGGSLLLPRNGSAKKGLQDRHRRPDEGSRSHRWRFLQALQLRDDLVAEAMSSALGNWKRKADAAAWAGGR